MKSSMKRRPARALRLRWSVPLLLALVSLPGTAPAKVSPLEVLSRQLRRPNILLHLDTSGSMFLPPGSSQGSTGELGMDCDNGVDCRTIGTCVGQCLLSQATCNTSLAQPGDCSTSSFPGDTCVKVAAPVVAGMCRLGLDRCITNAQCTAIAGDTCGPASSRMVIAKRVLSKTVNDFKNVANLGFMTFYQGGFFNRPGDPVFPTSNYGGFFKYFKTTSAVPVTLSVYHPRGKLESAETAPGSGIRCFDSKTGPAATCFLDGAAQTLKAAASSRYLVRGNSKIVLSYDVSWCGGAGPSYKPSGQFCSTIGAGGTGFGTYAGSYYQYTTLTGYTDPTPPIPVNLVGSYKLSAYPCVENTYRGKTFTGSCLANPAAGSGTWVYFDSRSYARNPPGVCKTPGQDAYIWDFETPSDCSTSAGQGIVCQGRPDQDWNCGLGNYNIGSAGTNINSAKTTPAMACTLNRNKSDGYRDVCGAKSGGKTDWTTKPLVPLGSTSTPADYADHNQNVLDILGRLEKVSYGGVSASGGTPSGFSFFNTGTLNKATSAYHYMQDVKVRDTQPEAACRLNAMVFVTDGKPLGVLENNCDVAACQAPVNALTGAPTADPAAAGCTCISVNNLYKMWKDLGVKTYVVGFSSEVVGDLALVNTLENMGRAGGTYDPSPPGRGKAHFLATSESELSSSISAAIFNVIAGSYSTSPAAASTGSQAVDHVDMGTLLLDARVAYPAWKGRLNAYDTSATTTVPDPVLGSVTTFTGPGGWNTETQFADAAIATTWKTRNVWTSNGSTMEKVLIDASGNITNKATLKTLMNAASDDEAERVMKWALGGDFDPVAPFKNNNPAVLGAMINSTPIDVGRPGYKKTMKGNERFDYYYSGRPQLVYVGSSDGMLHAFATKAFGSYPKGQEVFAYIPQDMLAVIRNLYAQGGQLADPANHIYGLANSPKVKNICTANCTVDYPSGSSYQPGSATYPQWKTVLMMPEGFGGSDSFVLDITEPYIVGTSTIKTATAPVNLMWHTQYANSATPPLTATDVTTYDASLGLTTSLPAFYFAKSSSMDDYRVIFASAYGTATNAGRVLINANARTGAIMDSDDVIMPGTCAAPTYPQAFALAADIATAKNYDAAETGNQIAAAYLADTHGRLWRYAPSVGVGGVTSSTGSISATPVMDFGCAHPLHYSPTVVQLDQYDGTTNKGQVYLAQVTNSALDAETKNFPASKLVILRDLVTSYVSSADPAWVPITLSAANPAEICAVKANALAACTTPMPVGARPTGTPMGIVKSDRTAFQLITLWYQPAPNSCTKGTTYITVHEVFANGTYKQNLGMKLADEPVTSAVIVGGNLTVATGGGQAINIGGFIPFVPAPVVKTDLSQLFFDRYRQIGWQEIM